MKEFSKSIAVVLLCLYLPAIPVAVEDLTPSPRHGFAIPPVEFLVFPGWFPAGLFTALFTGRISESTEPIVFSIAASVVTLAFIGGLAWLGSRNIGNMIGAAVIALAISISQAIYFAIVIALVNLPPGI